MKNSEYHLMENSGRYTIYKGEEKYLSKALVPICIPDRTFAEVIIRMMNERKPTLARRYLRTLDRNALINLLTESYKSDIYRSEDCETVLSHLSEPDLIPDSCLIRWLDGFAEYGSVALLCAFGTNDAYDNFYYDPFLSYYGIDSKTDFVTSMSNEIYLWLDEMDYELKEISEDTVSAIVDKYNAFLLPKSKRKREQFFERL